MFQQNDHELPCYVMLEIRWHTCTTIVYAMRYGLRLENAVVELGHALVRLTFAPQTCGAKCSRYWIMVFAMSLNWTAVQVDQ